MMNKDSVPLITSPVFTNSKISESISEKIMPSRPIKQVLENATEGFQQPLSQSPNLIEFPSKTNEMPAWKLELQSRVKAHKENSEERNNSVQNRTFTRRKVTSSRGSSSAALEVIEEETKHVNPTLAKALKRIESSRQANAHLLEVTEQVNFIGKPYLVDAPKIEDSTIAGKINTKFDFKPRTEDRIPLFAPQRTKSSENFDTKPILDRESISDDFMPIKPNEESNRSAFGINNISIPTKFLSTKSSTDEILARSENRIQISPRTELKAQMETVPEADLSEIDDIAAFGLRFNAALFDVIIGAFVSLVLISPFMLLGGKWFTIEGFFAFLATGAIVMFGYLTTTLGLFGRTFGMKLFSLEMIDAEVNDIPTFNQAAISSSVYLLSLALGGIGFLTFFFNTEKRLGHDIVSNTLVIHEI